MQVSRLEVGRRRRSVDAAHAVYGNLLDQQIVDDQIVIDGQAAAADRTGVVDNKGTANQTRAINGESAAADRTRGLDGEAAATA